MANSVDLGGLEPQTFGMQIRRSSQLSYRPFVVYAPQDNPEKSSCIKDLIHFLI